MVYWIQLPERSLLPSNCTTTPTPHHLVVVHDMDRAIVGHRHLAGSGDGPNEGKDRSGVRLGQSAPRAPAVPLDKIEQCCGVCLPTLYPGDSALCPRQFPRPLYGTKEFPVVEGPSGAISCRGVCPHVGKRGSGNCGNCYRVQPKTPSSRPERSGAEGPVLVLRRQEEVPRLHRPLGGFARDDGGEGGATPPPALSAWRAPRRSARRSTPPPSGAGRRPRTAPARWGWRDRGGCGRHGRRDRRWPRWASGSDF
jgi:hypothetical protein